MTHRLSGVLFAALALLSFNALAVTLDFEALAAPGTGQPGHGSTYTEDGFTISVAAGELHTHELDSPGFLESTAMSFGLQGTDGTLAAESGGAFSLSSIDLHRVNGGSPADITFTGFLEGGGTVTQVFSLVGTTSFNTFNFTASGFDNVTSVVWQNNSPFHEFDNIVVSAVPLPATVWLFGSGLLGMIGVARRRRLS